MFSTISRSLFRSSPTIQQCRNVSITATNYVRGHRGATTSNSSSQFGTFPDLQEVQEVQEDSNPEDMIETKGKI